MINSIGNSGTTTASYFEKQSNVKTTTGNLSNFQEILSNVNATEKAAISFAETNKNDFEAWKTHYFTQGIGENRRAQVESVSEAFKQIIDKAATNGGYNDPLGFVRSLSTTELDALQHIHCLAEPIIPQGLSKEGALNLLYSPDQSKDINNDGLSDVGLAKMWKYPPPNAPEAVKKAWKEATAGLSDMEAALKMGPFMPMGLPGEPGWKNMYAEPDFSYSKQVVDYLKSMEIHKPNDYEKQKAFFQSYLELLKKHPVA